MRKGGCSSWYAQPMRPSDRPTSFDQLDPGLFRTFCPLCPSMSMLRSELRGLWVADCDSGCWWCGERAMVSGEVRELVTAAKVLNREGWRFPAAPPAATFA